MNSEIMALALASKCGFFGSRSYDLASRSGFTGPASRLSCFSSHASAIEPMPIVLASRKWRREQRPLQSCLIRTSIYVQEPVRAQQRLAETGQRQLVGIVGLRFALILR